MKGKLYAASVLFLSLTAGCVASQPKEVPVVQPPVNVAAQAEVVEPEEIIPEKPGLDTWGHRITGHEVNKRWGMDKMTFSTAKSVPVGGSWASSNANWVPDGESWAFVCDKLADGQIPASVSFYWHRDDKDLWLKRNPNDVVKMAREIKSDTCWIAPNRPHSRSHLHWRSRNEMRYHLAVVDYFIAMGVTSFDVYGSSGGGTVAAMVLQERRRHVKSAGLASPPLSVKIWNPQVKNWWVYDPYHHMERLLFRSSEIPAVCLLIVWDPADKLVPEQAVLPYLNKAREMGLGENQIRLVQVRSNDHLRHVTSHKNLGREMRKLKQEGGFCL